MDGVNVDVTLKMEMLEMSGVQLKGEQVTIAPAVPRYLYPGGNTRVM